MRLNLGCLSVPLAVGLFAACAAPGRAQDAAPPPDAGARDSAPSYRSRISLRLGLVLSSGVSVGGGIDFPLPGLRLGPDFEGRVDVEALGVTYRDRPSGFFGGTVSGASAYIPVTFNQVYVGGLRRGGRVYGGFGLGGTFDVNIFAEQPGGFSGKLFAGAMLNDRTAAELGILFTRLDTLATLQVRVGL